MRKCTKTNPTNDFPTLREIGDEMLNLEIRMKYPSTAHTTTPTATTPLVVGTLLSTLTTKKEIVTRKGTSLLGKVGKQGTMRRGIPIEEMPYAGDIVMGKDPQRVGDKDRAL